MISNNVVKINGANQSASGFQVIWTFLNREYTNNFSINFPIKWIQIFFMNGDNRVVDNFNFYYNTETQITRQIGLPEDFKLYLEMQTECLDCTNVISSTFKNFTFITTQVLIETLE